MIGFQRQAGFRPLPIFPTIWRAYHLLWLNWRVIVRIALPAFVLVALGMALMLRKFWGMTPEQLSKLSQTMDGKQFLPLLLPLMAGSLLMVVVGASWRRFLLLHESPSSFDFTRPVCRYLVLLGISYFTVSFIGGFLLQMMMAGAGMALIAVVGVVAIMFTLLKHMLLFTAPLAGDAGLGWRQAGQLMRGNVLRYAAIWIMAILSAACVSNMLGALLTLAHIDGASIAGALTIATIDAAMAVVTTTLISAVAALAYDFVVRGGGPSS